MQWESEKREGEMDGWRGWKELRGRVSVCVHMCKLVRERERERALCSILWASRHCAGWEKRQLNPQSRKRTNTRIKHRRFVRIVRASLKVLRDASAHGRWAKWSGARQDSSRLERSCFLQPLTGGPCARGGELPPFLSLSLSPSFLFQSCWDRQHPLDSTLKTEDVQEKKKITEKKRTGL